MMGKFTTPGPDGGAKGGNIHRRTVPGMHGVISVDLEKITAFAKAHTGSSEPAGSQREGRRGSQLAEDREKQSRSRP